VLSVGAFGAAVAQRLSGRYPGSVVLDATAGSQLASWPALDVLVLAAEYDDAGLVDLLDQAAFAWRRPWFPVLLESAQLRCGPVVVPGGGACHRCFRRRRRQHARNPRLWPDRQPDAVPGSSPRVSGYAPHHVGIAVALATEAVRDATAGPAGPAEAPGAWVRTVSMVDGSVSRAGVLAVDGCFRCRDPLARERGRADLVEVLRAGLGDPPLEFSAGRLPG
jgi:bacteriocin biosynthesis cyclodehydratase domain-containing protein